MVNVSNEFKTSIYAPSRKTIANVEFQIVDVTAQSDATASVTSESEISQKDQVHNTNTLMSSKYATFENDYFKLDGSFKLPPKILTGYETGWWSNALCGANKVFSTPQILTIDFDEEHSSIGITITFDKLANEYAEEFTINVYDESNTIIYTTNVTANTTAKYILEQNLSNYRKIELVITKWCNAYRRARVTEISFGIIEEYSGEELIELSVLEELNTISEEVTSNETRVTIENQDKRFNILNPSSIYPYLQRRQKLIPYIGVELSENNFEYVKMGTFYLSEWKSDEGSLTATFTARDILDILSQNEFAGANYINKSLKYITEDVLSSAGITDYIIDSVLDSITLSITVEKINYRELLQMIAIAGQCVIYSNRQGYVVMKRLSSVATNEFIDFDNMYNSPQIKLDKLINTIIVNVGENEFVYLDPLKPIKEETFALKIENPFITTNEIAENVAVWVLDEYKKRFLYEVNWRGNPALQSGDIINVQDDFAEDRAMIITKNEFEFAGTLSCRTYGRGGG
jgi:hypothetical protein